MLGFHSSNSNRSSMAWGLMDRTNLISLHVNVMVARDILFLAGGGVLIFCVMNGVCVEWECNSVRMEWEILIGNGVGMERC